MQQFAAFLSNANSIDELFNHKQIITEEEFIPIANRSFNEYRRTYLQLLVNFMSKDCNAFHMFHIDQLDDKGFSLYEIFSHAHERYAFSRTTTRGDDEDLVMSTFFFLRNRLLFSGVAFGPP